jgi:DNA-binding LacI/PurR family transcriptional regulator
MKPRMNQLIYNNWDEMGRAAADLLIRRVNNPVIVSN